MMKKYAMNESQLSFVCQGGTTIKSVFNGKPAPDGANLGLVFDRYLKIWNVAQDNTPILKNKTTLYGPLQDFVKAFNERGKSLSNQYLDTFHRRTNLVDGHLKIEQKKFVLSWRLATGLGGFHPSENGFSFDYLTGAPMLAGSGVKGLCRRVAKIGLVSIDENEIIRLFGPEEIVPGMINDGEGCLVFYDAYPAKWPKLSVDIINSHHMEYYELLGKDENSKKNKNPEYERKRRNNVFPRETENPNPVFFLTVEKGVEFIFPIGCLDKRSSNPEGDLEIAHKLLEEGLQTLGIGAKTAIGYGFFDAPE